MTTSPSRVFLVTLCMILTVSACWSAVPADPETAKTPLVTLARVHWLGAHRIAADTNAAALARVWALPESATFKGQTLSKLSVAPWTWLHREINTNASAHLRPLLDDIVGGETRLEVLGITNHPTAFAFAIRLNTERFRLWETNLVIVLQSLVHVSPASLPEHRAGWAIRRQAKPELIAFTSRDGWSILGVAEDLQGFDEMSDRLLHKEDATVEQGSNAWLTLTADWSLLAPVMPIGWRLPCKVSNLSIVAKGEDRRIRMEAVATFQEPPKLDFPIWNIPANLINQPLSSITAIRGLRPLLTGARVWNSLRLGPPPSEIFIWALQGQLMQTYFTADLPDPSNTVAHVTQIALEKNKAWFGTNNLGGFRRSAASDGLEWAGLPYLWPFLKSISTNGQDLVLGGSFAFAPVPNPVSPEFFRAALSSDNLVYYGWEKTGRRIEQWLFMGQFARYVFHYPQLPFESSSLLWLKSIEPEVGDSITRLNLTSSNQLTLTRTSTLGLTAIELHLLADWLESPQFPRGLHTLLATPQKSKGTSQEEPNAAEGGI